MVECPAEVTGLYSEFVGVSVGCGSYNMDCPVCKNAMITLELEDVEIDHCLDCGGIWLDAGELELLLDEPEKARSLLESFSVDSKSAETCRGQTWK